MREPATLVVVSGPPGAGKTTLAEELSRRLGLPLLGKDMFKEALFDRLGTGDRAWSRTLGMAAWDVIFITLGQLLTAGVSCVVEGNFWRTHETARFRALAPARVVQVHVSAPLDTILERYAARDRHPGHLGTAVLPEIEARTAEGEWEPLELGGELIRVDGSRPVDLEALAARVSAASADARAAS